MARWSVAECQSRYETLRGQALESGRPSRAHHLELSFIERQGLAAWLARGPEGPAGNTVSVDSPTDPPAEAQPPRCDLILALTDLILGDRQEPRHGRRS